MSIAEKLLIEFDFEMPKTRISLSRVPADRLGWKPHEKSFSFAQLAGHLAEIPGWIMPIIKQTDLNLNPPGGEPYKTPTPDSVETLLATFDKNIAAVRPVLAAAKDEQMPEMWSLLFGDHTIFTVPKIGVLRNFVFNHIIHHRAQLGLYLRMNDIAVPSIYGPSKDEG